MSRLWWLLFVLPEMAFASEIVQCNPADSVVPNRAIRYERSSNTQASWLTDPTYVVNPATLPPGPDRYWKCEGGGVIAMTLSERTALDAPLAASTAKAAALQSEVLSNDLCTAELTDLDSRIDTAVMAITDLNSAKTFLSMAFKKIARCIRARAG